MKRLLALGCILVPPHFALLPFVFNPNLGALLATLLISSVTGAAFSTVFAGSGVAFGFFNLIFAVAFKPVSLTGIPFIDITLTAF